MKRNFYIGAIFLALVAALAAGSVVLEKKATAEAADALAPRFDVAVTGQGCARGARNDRVLRPGSARP